MGIPRTLMKKKCADEAIFLHAMKNRGCPIEAGLNATVRSRPFILTVVAGCVMPKERSKSGLPLIHINGSCDNSLPGVISATENDGARPLNK